jgi:hypothetical protein
LCSTSRWQVGQRPTIPNPSPTGRDTLHGDDIYLMVNHRPKNARKQSRTNQNKSHSSRRDELLLPIIGRVPISTPQVTDRQLLCACGNPTLLAGRQSQKCPFSKWNRLEQTGHIGGLMTSTLRKQAGTNRNQPAFLSEGRVTRVPICGSSAESLKSTWSPYEHLKRPTTNSSVPSVPLWQSHSAPIHLSISPAGRRSATGRKLLYSRHFLSTCPILLLHSLTPPAQLGIFSPSF